jgi:hypothetical protein
MVMPPLPPLHAAGVQELRRRHQDRVIAETAVFRPNGSDADSLFSRFWGHWQQQRARGAHMGERIGVQCRNTPEARGQLSSYVMQHILLCLRLNASLCPTLL